MSENENESRKTVADEIKICPLCGGRVFWFPISNYWGCEHCKNVFNRYTVFPDEVKKNDGSRTSAGRRGEMMSPCALSVRDAEKALECLRIERMRRDMDVVKTYYWEQGDGELVSVGSMSNEHLSNTIAMLLRMKDKQDIVMEGGAE